MDLLQFLKPKESPNFPGIFILQINSQESLLFNQYIFDYIKRNWIGTIKKVDANLFDEIHPELYVSFLGQSAIYWVSGELNSDNSIRQKWITFAANYSGPHSLVIIDIIDTAASQENSFFSLLTSCAKTNINLIDVPEKIDIHYYNQLYSLFYVPTSADSLFVSRLFKNFVNINIENAFKIMHYQATVGRNTDDFFATWLPKLIVSEKSLFTLSQYLFARQSKEFFDYWQKIKLDYPDEFWVSYWSGQIWQAATFITIASQGNILDAKKAVFGLPFSFTNKDWRNYNINFLSNANNFLYKLDYNMKNGCSAGSLEVWFNKFLLKDF